MKNQTEQNLVKLFESWSGEKANDIINLPRSGSDRRYYRITGNKKTAMGVSNPDKKENIAFLSFTKHFFSKGLPVPEIYAEDAEKDIYLLQDLGDITLFAFLTDLRKGDKFPEKAVEMYKKTIGRLPEFQVTAGKNLDYNVCYPRAFFDKQSMMWDLSYFKYYFLKLAKIPYDEQKLEDDFQSFSDYLLQADCNYFLYRDFQSRNIMICNDKPYFIDYQGGRKGALQYDIASMLYDSKADIPGSIKEILINHYLGVLEKIMPVKKQEFMQYYHGYVLIRIMQAMGAYGFRGFYEKKEIFLQSIPFAVKHLKELLKEISLPVRLPALLSVLENITVSEHLKKFDTTGSKLKVTIYSFSYKKGISADESGNYGGFVFDCRAINNPGRHDDFKSLTGKDKKVIEFLEKESDVADYLTNVYALTDKVIKNYIQRNFTNLMVCFGCTGGQHRSVYCAEQLSEHIKNIFDVEVILQHRELE